MPLFYKPMQATIASKNGAKLWHPAVVKMGRVVDTITLAESIAEKSSLTVGDVVNVVRNLMTSMRSYLLNSRSVRLDGLGIFTIKASSRGKGVATSDEVNHSQIVNLKCHFNPEYSRPFGGNTTRAMWQGVQFENLNKVEASTSGGDNTKPDGDGGGVIDPTE